MYIHTLFRYVSTELRALGLSADKPSVMSDVSPVISDDWIAEFIRWGGAELHSIASVLGGVAAQVGLTRYMYRYRYIDMYMYMNAYIYMYVFVYVYRYRYIDIYIYVYRKIDIYTSIYLYIYICVCVCVCVCVYPSPTIGSLSSFVGAALSCVQSLLSWGESPRR